MASGPHPGRGALSVFCLVSAEALVDTADTRPRTTMLRRHLHYSRHREDAAAATAQETEGHVLLTGVFDSHEVADPGGRRPGLP